MPEMEQGGGLGQAGGSANGQASGGAGLAGSQAGASSASSPGAGVSGSGAGAQAGVGSGVAGASQAGVGQVAGSGAGAGSGGTAAQQASFRETMRQYGLDLSHYQDDSAAMAQVALAWRQSQQSNQLAHYGNLYLQNRDVIEHALRDYQQRQVQQQQQQRRWFSLPEYDPRWSQMIERDQATGEYRVKPGYPPDVLGKLTSYASALQDLQTKFWQDPESVLGPLVQHVAAQVAQQAVQQHLGGYQAQTFAADFVSQNSSWIHQRDGQGKLVVDPATGRPALSEWGQRFARYVVQAEQGLGIGDVRRQQEYALAMVQRDYLAVQGGQQSQQAAAQQAGDAAKQQFLQQAAGAAGAMHQPNMGGSVQAQNPNGTQPSQNASLGLRERMRRNMQAAGFQPGAPLS